MLKGKKGSGVTETKDHESSVKQVTFREMRSRRLRPDRVSQLCMRLFCSLKRQFGSLRCEQTLQDFIAEAICGFYEQCRRKRAFANNDRPVFPYLLRSAEHVAMLSLANAGKSSYEKARRLECSTTESEIAFESIQFDIQEARCTGDLQVSDEYMAGWNSLSANQKFVLKANANALTKGFEIRAEHLGEELGKTRDTSPFAASTIRQYKSRALKQIRKQVTSATVPPRIEHDKTKQ